MDFVLTKKINLKDMEIFEKVAMDFFFTENSPDEPYNTLMFAKKDCIFNLNFETEQTEVLYTLKDPFARQPQFFKCNESQKIILIASKQECFHINLDKKEEIDLDHLYSVKNIESVSYDDVDKCFYLLSNKLRTRLGLYLLQINEIDPSQYNYVIKWNTKLKLGG